MPILKQGTFKPMGSGKQHELVKMSLAERAKHEATVREMIINNEEKRERGLEIAARCRMR